MTGQAMSDRPAEYYQEWADRANAKAREEGIDRVYTAEEVKGIVEVGELIAAVEELTGQEMTDADDA